MSSSIPPLPFTVSKIIQTPKHKIFSLPLSLSSPHKLRFSPLNAASFSPFFSSQSQHNNAFEEEEEENLIGDCLVFEDGIFDDPFLQNNNIKTPSSSNKNTSISPENLIPDKWLEVQKELNITKKERRKLSQQLEFGTKVETKRLGLVPITTTTKSDEEIEKIKNERLKQQLKPLVLDNPEIKYVEDDDDDDKRNDEEIRGRVAARNPRLAVYGGGGGGLEEISELFSSGSYEPRPLSDNSKVGTRKLFSKEEKSLFNRRVPDLTVATSGKWHPLHTLAASGEFYLVNALLKHNLDINAPDKDGLTAIHKAILGKKQAIFNFLLRESANPFVRDAEGATLMHYAVFAASSQMIKILLLYNVDMNIQDNDGWTALHLAVQSRRTDIVRLLLIKGADKTLKNRDGLTALDLCLYSGRDTRTYELIRLIKRHSKTSITL